MVDFTNIRAIDFHTHAEEPCGCPADDGDDDLQSTMAKYFGGPWQHPPTIPQPAAHNRAQNVAAVIFPLDYPDMPSVLAHPSCPPQEEAQSLDTHKPNVNVCLSGWSFKYFPEILVRYANTLLKRKVLFGSDWPMIAPEKWRDAFDKAAFKDSLRPLILKVNAMQLLGA